MVVLAATKGGENKEVVTVDLKPSRILTMYFKLSAITHNKKTTRRKKDDQLVTNLGQVLHSKWSNRKFQLTRNKWVMLITIQLII